MEAAMREHQHQSFRNTDFVRLLALAFAIIFLLAITISAVPAPAGDNKPIKSDPIVDSTGHQYA
jgi:hypothetical protein